MHFPVFLFTQFQVLLELSSTGFQVTVTVTVSATMHLPWGRDPGKPAGSGPGMDGARPTWHPSQERLTPTRNLT